MTYKNLTDRQKNEVAKKYNNLVVKITKQFFNKGFQNWDQIESMAWEGLALAIDKYDDERSNMNFTQYAAFAIRNNILNCLTEESRTVKMSHYMQQKAKEKGDALFTTVSLDRKIDTQNEDDKRIKEFKFNAYTKASFADGDTFEYLYSRLNEKFPKRECEMFYKAFGLNGYDDTKGKDIAKEYGVSEGLVSQKIKKMTSWIRKDNEMCEMLQNLM